MVDEYKYIKSFNFAKNLSKKTLTNEIDRVWDSYHLSSKNFKNINLFYQHPVWILNGLWTYEDKNSVLHRHLVVKFFKDFFKNRPIKVSDYGGGAGSLGKICVKLYNNIKCYDIIEPYPFIYFKKKLKKEKKIFFKKKIKKNFYDVLIMQTVLEHVNNPIDVLKNVLKNFEKGKLILIGNDFYPIEKCHIKTNFYLRHTFNWVVQSLGLKFISVIKGCEYMNAYEVVNSSNKYLINIKILIARMVGPLLNIAVDLYQILKKNIFNILKKPINAITNYKI
jgi:2-polyprenyl-3-methyl-5-hydroxy-6-metoxy-1,4-benzoquinol methylase